MVTQAYLQHRIKNCSHYGLTDSDKKYLHDNGLEGYIFRVLTRKKFRKWKLEPDVQQVIKEVISKNVKQDTPIQFVFPFGGYKLWRMPTSPEVDWAEFFVIAHCLEYIAPILPVYKPGVVFYFSSDDIIVELMDNIPPANTDRYFNSFKILLKNFQQYFSPNLKIEIRRIADFYPDKGKFIEELEQMIRDAKENFRVMDKDKIKNKIKTSKLNIQWQGSKDLTGLSEQEKEAKIKFGPVLHDAYCKMTDRRLFLRGGDKIMVFSTPIPNSISIGTTKSSITKFWTGLGVLEKKGDDYLDRILSPQQLEQVKNTEHKQFNIDLIPLKNFQQIRVFSQNFDFVNKK